MSADAKILMSTNISTHPQNQNKMKKQEETTQLGVCGVISRFFTEIKKGKVIEKKCNCGKIYKDHKRIEKRYIPVCDSCLPF